MVRMSDGMRGIVIDEGGELRISFRDRGEYLLAGKQEKWVRDDPPPTKLRMEEMLEIAHEADAALRAIAEHEPLRWWERKEGPPYDPALVALIVDHLSRR
jgi:hypothetical protein